MGSRCIVVQKILNFEVEKIKLIQDFSDSQLAIAELMVCSTGNNLHNKPIDLETLKLAMPTLVNKFLVADIQQSGYFGKKDFKGHTKPELSKIIGFFPAENDFQLIEDEEEEGKFWFKANAIISKTYAPYVYDLFVKKNYKSVSMEISILETEDIDGKEHVKAFVFNGVSILGDNFTPAINNANIKMFKFSKEDNTEFEIEKQKFNDYFSKHKGSLDFWIVYLNNKKTEEKLDFSTESDKNTNKEVRVLNKQEMLKKFTALEGSVGFSFVEVSETIAYAFEKETKKLFAIPFSINEEEIDMSFEDKKQAQMACKYEFTEVVETEKESEKSEDDLNNDSEKDKNVYMSVETFIKAQNELFSLSANEKKEVLRNAIKTALLNDDYLWIEDYGDDWLVVYIENEYRKYLYSITEGVVFIDLNSFIKVKPTTRYLEFGLDTNVEAMAQIEMNERETVQQQEMAEQEFKEDVDDKGETKQVEMSMEKVSEFAESMNYSLVEKTELERLVAFEKDILLKEKEQRINFEISLVKDVVPINEIENFQKKINEFENIDAWANALKAKAFEFSKQTEISEKKKVIGFAWTNEQKTEKKKWY
jgi:hypothetical protein